jgi:hypothetical protein
MPLVCEISVEAHCLPNDVIRPIVIHAFDQLPRNLTIHAQLNPISIALLANQLPLTVRLTWCN